MGSTLNKAIRDWERFSSSGGFEVEFTLNPPPSFDTDFLVKGIQTNHRILVDTDEQIGNSKFVAISISEALLVAISYPIRNAESEVSMLKHRVSFVDSAGTNRTYEITEQYPDETTGMLTFLLKDFEIVIPAFDPFTDTETEVYWNTKNMVVGVDNIYGDITAGALTSNIKDAKGNSLFDLKQTITASKPFFDGTKVICDSVNDHLLSDGIPLFIANNSDYTIYLIFDFLDINVSQVEWQAVKFLDAGQPLIQLGTSGGGLQKPLSISRQTSNKLLHTSDTYTNGQKIIIKFDWKAAWTMDVNGTIVTDTPDVRQVPIGMDRMIVGANGLLTNFTPTAFRGGLIMNTLQTDPVKNALVSTFIANNF